jgi:uncharacterized protein (TIGR03067 family)
MRMHLFWSVAALALLSSSGSFVAADDAKADAIKKELAKLQGTWQLLSAETDGKLAPAEQVKKIRVVIKENSHTVYFGDKPLAEKVRFEIDPTKKPKTTDDTLADGRVIRGIYELDGDTLRSCVAAIGKERPTEFSAKAGTGQTLRVFRRMATGDGASKADAARDKAIQKERHAMAGTWKFDFLELDGEKAPEAHFKDATVVVKGEQFTLVTAAATHRGTFTLDPSKRPRTIDFTFTEGPEKGNVSLGIYELDDDTWRICLGPTAKRRPAAFMTRKGSGHAFEVLKRTTP